MAKHLLKNLKQAVLMTCLTAAASSAGASVIFEDNFNANNFYSIWNVSDPNVDVGNYTDLCDNGAGGYCVDTEGTGASSNATFNIITPIALLVAGDYTFSFDWGNNFGSYNAGNNILNWLINSDQGLVASGSINSGAAADHTYETASFAFSSATPNTNAVISFAQVGAEGDWGGTILDNVKFELVNAYPVPAPAPALLLGLGLLGLGTLRSRRG